MVIAAQLAKEDAQANDLDDALALAIRAEIPLRGTAAILRNLERARHPDAPERDHLLE